LLAHIFKFLKAHHIFLLQEKKGGLFYERAEKDALDILTMAYSDPFIFTYSSGFGALALQLKQNIDNFCSNWASLDWGKREWPPIGTIGAGGIRGVKYNSDVVSKICQVSEIFISDKNSSAYCTVYLNKRNTGNARIFSFCNC